MTEWREYRAPTVDQAVEAALADLGLTPDLAEVEVLAEPKPGLLGRLAAKEAVIRVRPRPDKVKLGEQFVREVAVAIGVPVSVESRAGGDHWLIELKGEDLGLLIGRRGQTLDALQYLTNLAVGRLHPDRTPIVLDAAGYRQRRAESLRRAARLAADRARRLGRRVPMEAMPAHERRIVHLALQDDPDVVTQSEGEEPFRRVVVTPKDPRPRPSPFGPRFS